MEWKITLLGVGLWALRCLPLLRHSRHPGPLGAVPPAIWQRDGGHRDQGPETTTEGRRLVGRFLRCHGLAVLMASPAITAITATMDAVPKRSSSTVWNSTAWTTIRTAAYAGMKFDPGDFGLIVRRYGRALGVDSIERLYSLSCGIRSAAPESRIRPNTSAARSIERFLQRRPFMFFEHGGPKAPRRAAVGLVFPWPPEGLWLHLTSFAADGETIIGTAYRG